MLFVHERIGLVDKQHAALGFPEFALYKRRGVADVFADEIAPARLNYVAGGEHAVIAHYFGKQPGNSRFCGAGIAKEGHVHGQALELHAHFGKNFARPAVVYRLVYHLFDFGKAGERHELCIRGACYLPAALLLPEALYREVFGIGRLFEHVAVPFVVHSAEFGGAVRFAGQDICKEGAVGGNAVLFRQPAKVVFGPFGIDYGVGIFAYRKIAQIFKEERLFLFGVEGEAEYGEHAVFELLYKGTYIRDNVVN